MTGGGDAGTRSTEDVFEDHLASAARGDTDGDIERNFAPDVVLLTGLGVFRGHDGVRRSRAILAADLPGARYEYLTRLVDGDAAFLEWQATAEDVQVDDGADGFIVADGRIRVQTIHYTLRHRPGHHDRVTHAGETSADAGPGAGPDAGPVAGRDAGGGSSGG